jgi:hypothetical protein
MMQDADAKGTGMFANNETIFKTLDDLYHTTRQMLRKSTITLEDTRQLAGYVTQARVLLAELEHIETRLHRSETALSSISGLKLHYLELESMVKEARNTLHRSGPGDLAAF